MDQANQPSELGLTFRYNGTQLQEPLSRLVAFLEVKHAEALANLESVSYSTDSTDPAILHDLLKKEKGPAQDYRRQANTLHADLLEAELWLEECKRTPGVSWTLSMKQLKWIYRYKF